MFLHGLGFQGRGVRSIGGVIMRWVSLLFASLIVSIIVLADLGAIPSHLIFWNDYPYGDKAGHFILFGVLTLLIDLSLFRSLREWSPWRIAAVAGVVLALLIGLEEYSQQYFADRTFSLLDLAASYLGVMFFSWLALRLDSKRRAGRT